MHRQIQRHNVVREDSPLQEWWEGISDFKDRTETLLLIAAAFVGIFFIGKALTGDSPAPPSHVRVSPRAEEAPATTVVETTLESENRAQPIVGEADPNASERAKATHEVGPISPLGEPGV